MALVFPVASTKLVPPVSVEDVLDRPRLTPLLDAVGRMTLTLVRAGAGYGKTTLLARKGALPLPLVWYSLSESDADLAVFLAHLEEGVRRHFPDFGSDSDVEAAQRPAGRSVGLAAARFSERLGGLDTACLTLVLDDYHSVDRNPAIRRFLNSLVPQLPPTLHVVISTRRTPGLSCVARLVLAGRAQEMGEEELRFNGEEARSLLSAGARQEVDEEVLATIVEQTEGWVIGLRLVSQSFRATDRWSETALRPGDSGAGRKRLFEYLMQEVYGRQRPAMQRFLAESSVLSVLSPGVCDALLERNDSASMLEAAERENLFLVQLGDGSWRYHHLFRDFLRTRLVRVGGRASVLQSRAGHYFLAEGDPIRATQHLLAGSHFEEAAALIQRLGPRLIQTSRFDTLSSWIAALPAGFVADRPEILHLQFEVLSLQGHYDEAMAWLERAAQAYANREDGVGLARILRDRAFHASWRLARNAEATELCRRGLSLLGPDHALERADLLRSIALSSLVVANTVSAMVAYEQALSIYEALGERERLMSLLINPGTWIYWMQGRFAEGLESLERARGLAEALGSTHGLAECLGGLAIHLANLGRSEEARECAEQAVALSTEVGAVNLQAYNLSFLGWVYASGPSPDLKLARQHLEASARLARGERNERVRLGTEWVRIGVLRRLGETQQAVEAGETALEAAQETTDQWLVASIELSLGSALSSVDPGRAKDLIRSANARSKTFGNRLDQARAHLWLAWLSFQDDAGVAVGDITACFRLCREGDFGFMLLEEPAVSVPVIFQALCRGIESGYCAQMIERIGPCALDHVRAPGATKTVSPPASAARTPQVPPLNVRCLGAFRVAVGDLVIEEGRWKRRKPKRLLQLIATSPECTISWDKAADHLWPGLAYKEAHVGLSRSLYELRRTIWTEDASAYVVSSQGMIRLRTENLGSVDVHRFTEHIRAAQRAERSGALQQAERRYEAADTLYTGDLLEDELYEDWTVPLRDHLRGQHLLVLERLARRRLESADYESARTYLERLLARDPLREDAHALLMTCYSRMGKRRQALLQYEACADVLQRESRLEPSPATRRLVERILASEIL
jgi:LuxR family transcriptional regulator, maltose regulon positive regulatory protein